LKLNESPFSKFLLCTNYENNTSCENQYTIDENLILTSNLKDAYIIVSYKAYTKNEDGECLIPDDEDLKDSLFHYCLYRYFTSKIVSIADKNMFRLYREQQLFHLSQFELLKTKFAGKSNSPNLDQLENIRRENNRLLPKART
jgi:hypothetical protein